jgi:beta-glucosidase-like glycosyl hydrolase
LDFYAPNINLALHPKWGRLQETYGEDPRHVAEMSTAYVLGMQNWNWTDPHSYVEVMATCKVRPAEAV